MKEQEQEPRAVVTIDEVKFYRDSLDQESEQILKDIITIHETAKEKQKELNIISLARTLLMNKLSERSDQFEKVLEENKGD